VPVVKSYPQFSQKSASGGFGSEQFGHAWLDAAGAAAPTAAVPAAGAVTAGAGTDADAGVAATPMGRPHTSQ
jgi:hypothetical protein